MPGEYVAPRGISLLLHIEDGGRAERVFARLGVGGSIQMPLQSTFWAGRFGIPWMINVPLPSVPTPRSPVAG